MIFWDSRISVAIAAVFKESYSKEIAGSRDAQTLVSRLLRDRGLLLKTYNFICSKEESRFVVSGLGYPSGVGGDHPCVRKCLWISKLEAVEKLLMWHCGGEKTFSILVFQRLDSPSLLAET